MNERQFFADNVAHVASFFGCPFPVVTTWHDDTYEIKAGPGRLRTAGITHEALAAFRPGQQSLAVQLGKAVARAYVTTPALPVGDHIVLGDD